jgi:undecaprenyl diphosphate synthase
MIPKHVAIIMDGNGRWAQARGLPKIMGHRAGVESVKKVVSACLKFGIKYLTLYAFSTENWDRPRDEIAELFNLLENFIDKEVDLFKKNNVRLNIIGERERLNQVLRKKIEESEGLTKDNTALFLNIALSYGSREEIVRAAKVLAENIKEDRMRLSDIDEKIFSECLYTKNQPDPDLLIRTSGEMRLSNFLLWQLSYAEIYVTPKLWPDFGEADMEEAIKEYQKRQRRFGK